MNCFRKKLTRSLLLAANLQIFGRMYSISPKEVIPIRLLTSVIDTLISSRGIDVIINIIRFTLSCLETSSLLTAFFGLRIDDNDNDSDIFQRVSQTNHSLGI